MFDEKMLRMLLRKGESVFITQPIVMQVLRLKKNEIPQALQKLEDLGYVERIDIDECWGVAMKGKLYAAQTFPKLYKVESLRRHLEDFQARLLLINSSQDFAHVISKAKVVSEYPIVNRSHGIKIMYSLIRKDISKREHRRIENKLVSKSKKNLYSLIDRLSYPEVAVYEMLKSRSHVLKLEKVAAEEIDSMQGFLFYSNGGSTAG